MHLLLIMKNHVWGQVPVLLCSIRIKTSPPRPPPSTLTVQPLWVHPNPKNISGVRCWIQNFGNQLKWQRPWPCWEEDVCVFCVVVVVVFGKGKKTKDGKSEVVTGRMFFFIYRHLVNGSIRISNLVMKGKL